MREDWFDVKSKYVGTVDFIYRYTYAGISGGSQAEFRSEKELTAREAWDRANTHAKSHGASCIAKAVWLLRPAAIERPEPAELLEVRRRLSHAFDAVDAAHRAGVKVVVMADLEIGGSVYVTRESLKVMEG